MAQVLYGAGDAVEAPRRILTGHAQDQLFDHVRDRRPSKLLLPAVTVVPLLGNERPMPAQDCIGGEQRADEILLKAVCW